MDSFKNWLQLTVCPTPWCWQFKFQTPMVRLTRFLGSCGWLAFLFPVHTHDVDAVLRIRQQVWMKNIIWMLTRKTAPAIPAGIRGVTIELTLQQEGVCGSTNIHLLDVVVRSDGVVTNDKTRDVARCGHVRHCPCHSDVVRTHPSKLQLGGCWNDWKNKRKELKNAIFCLESEKYLKK